MVNVNTVTRSSHDIDAPSASLLRTVTSDWRRQLPLLNAEGITLRELRVSDAPSLCEFLSTEEVSRFISPPPTTVDGYERFIEWTHQQRAAGAGVVFGIVPDGCDAAVGLIQVRALGQTLDTAEWGFAIGSRFWGTGAFMSSALSVLRFSFDVLGVRRLEARACVANGRGNGVLEKLGASCDAVLRQSFVKNGVRLDQYLWSMTSEAWQRRPRRTLILH